MIVAGLLLLAVGAAALVRTLFRRAGRTAVRIGLSAVTVGVLLIGLLTDAFVAGLAAVLVAALWLWLMPDHGRSPASIWPTAGLGVLVAASLLLIPADYGTGLTAQGAIASPLGPLSAPVALLMIGAAVYLLEPANVVVRAALERENIAPAADPDDPPASAEQTVAASLPAATPKPGPGQVMKGGRLIGPLERTIVFGLTLAAAYPLLAAFIAAKGIVRFPEISRDRDDGDRAEYFLVGSMVSWVQALAAAFLVWWGLNS
ncbi:hypothetical protein [Microbacterium marinilacus]|uniref:Uncharacterized protein n=1 Tax=Microbacterium marinilacus TaxID=415209 RepID=A0ABP7BNM6_9MICO|nr:hypothetical protein [Microbacterium marinilacus]MBY0689793.1 hypothetical protein [Microbacterium marinilacus]